MNVEDYDVSKLTSRFKIEALREILKLHFVDPKTRIMEDTLHLVAEVIRIMTTEAVLRASRQACMEEESEVQVCHVEKILPQLLVGIRCCVVWWLDVGVAKTPGSYIIGIEEMLDFV